MNTLFPTDPDSEEEEILRKDVNIAINRAIEDIELDLDRNLTEIEREKLTHFSILDCGVPLTYSWYLAGGHTMVSNEREETTRETTTSPAHANRFVDLSSSKEGEERVQELREYFRSREFIPGYSLANVLYTDIFQFLKDYYQELAPEEYRELYLTSLELRKKLRGISENIRNSSEHKDLSEFGVISPQSVLPDSDEEEIRDLVSKFHIEIMGIEKLNNTTTSVFEGTDTIEIVLSKLTNVQEVNTKQKRLLQQDGLHDYFYYYVWKYPALAISADTAQGPNSDELHRKRLLKFNQFDKRLDTKTKRLTQQANEAKLLPKPDEPVSGDSEIYAVFRELTDPK